MADNVLSEFLNKNKPLLGEHRISEIQKMLLCGNPSQGYSTYKCTKCGNVEIIHFSCNSRLCPSCGRRMTEEWADRIKKHLIDCVHRHCIFTLPAEIRPLMKDRGLIKVAEKVILTVVKNVFTHQCKKIEITPGIVMVLHTFGEDMKFNVHFHCIVTAGGLNNAGDWIDLDFFFYEALRMVWQYEILTAMKEYLPKTRENARFIDKMFKDYPNGFYVNAERKVENNRDLLMYIARYVRHPAIAQSRIKDFDGKNVTFICKKHKDRPERTIIMPVQEFLLALVQHIPPKGFQMTRHLGLYANKSRRKYASVIRMFQKHLKFMQKKLFSHSPKCRKCGGIMELMDIYPPTDPPEHLVLANYLGQQKLRVSG